MDSHDAAFHSTHDSTGNASQGRPSVDQARVRSSRLQKQRSTAGASSVSHGQPRSSPGQNVVLTGTNGFSSSGVSGDRVHARKGSIRNAVRKIFGRRSRDVGPQGSVVSADPYAPRHTYHQSDPTTALVPTREEPEPYIQDGDFFERTLSAPYQPVQSPSFNRTGSPYAVQFPNSVRLKPMDLGNPFISPPNQLRRRKTLPGTVEGEPSAETGRDSTAAARPLTSEPTREQPAMPQRTAMQIKKARRKSRSTDDLKRSTLAEDNLARKRSEEIRYWRESFQPDVLRASGFTTRSPEREPAVEECSPTPRKKCLTIAGRDVVKESEEHAPLSGTADSHESSVVTRSSTFRSSPPFSHSRGLSGNEGDSQPSSGVGTELSKDLEERVAKLEAGLQNFQRSLQRMTTGRNRRTVIMGGSMTARRSSTDLRTPSLLADTLIDPLEPSSYQYEYGHTVRPSTSPPPPQQPPPEPPLPTPDTLEDPFGPSLARQSVVQGQAEPTADRFKIPSPLSSHPPNQHPPVPQSRASRNQPQPYTFSSLYQMLADERSARRKLETQLRGLRQDISDLHSQVASSSKVQSARSSYMIAGSSSRLQELLRDTESSPPNSQQSPHRDSGVSAGYPAVTSRFSGSESEAGTTDYEDLTTPYEAYRTPREERSKASLAGAQSARDADDDSDIF